VPSTTYTAPTELADIRKELMRQDYFLSAIIKNGEVRLAAEDEIRKARTAIDDAYTALVGAENLARRFGPRLKAAS
jgi:hypothetical protein